MTPRTRGRAKVAMYLCGFAHSCAFTLTSLLAMFSLSEHVGASFSAAQIVPGTEHSWSNESPGLAQTGTNGSAIPPVLDALLDAIDVMQTRYFDVGTATWPESIDWTAAVFGTHVSATLSTLIESVECGDPSGTCTETRAWDNLVSRYFGQTSIFYFGENALSLRQQAYDDMLWVVLEWLESIKLMDLYTSLRSKDAGDDSLLQQAWHGTQFRAAAAHRAHLFYDLASRGWDTSLCGGGMVWSPYLTPYKNSITNELFISASISMYLYFPGDDNDSPFLASDRASSSDGGRKDPKSHQSYPHEEQHLSNAIKAYDWLRLSNMTNSPSSLTSGLYADGFHVSGWHRTPSGHIDPGTGRCDQLNTMVYTYNQGVVLTGLRGLWIATAETRYLEDGHDLISAVITATGWDDRETDSWQGLGRGGVLEEYCDSSGGCSQNGQTFKGIFFHHLAEFCRPLRAEEKNVVSNGRRVRPLGTQLDDFGGSVWERHLSRCSGYRLWVQHNAGAAAMTRDEKGRFGTWWGQSTASPFDPEAQPAAPPCLPPGAVDHANNATAAAEEVWKSTRPFGRPPLPPPATPANSNANVDADADADTYIHLNHRGPPARKNPPRDPNDRGRGRTVETQSGGVAVLRALWQWQTSSNRQQGGCSM